MPKHIGAFFFVFYCLTLSAAEPWWNSTTFYEIFSRSFQDSNGDGVGDLRGITSRLDYLNNGEADDVAHPKSLGVKGIWLTPIFQSPSYHGYDATDYKAIDSDYGTMEDFETLIRESHRRGIKVILDIAVNHTSSEHPWFKEAKVSKKAKYRDWYVWRDKPATWGKWYKVGNQYYYSFFDRSMPNLNWKNPEVRAAVKDLLRFWMLKGVDGFRLDAARYYVPGPNGEDDTPETHAAIAAFATAIRAEFPNAFFVGEIWADVKTIHSYCASGKELDMGFNFPLAFGLVPTLNKQNTDHFAYALYEYQKVYKDTLASAPFLSNHDMTRVATDLWNYTPKIKLAAEIYFMLPGTPFVYYGEELGMPNGKVRDDLAKRQPMQWTSDKGFGFTPDEAWQSFLGQPEVFSVAAQTGKAGSLLELYKKLIHFRNGSKVMSLGTLEKHFTSQSKTLLLWTRHYQNETALVVANLSHNGSSPFALEASLGKFSKIVKVLYGGASPKSELEIPALPPHSAHVFLVE